jgi:SAM-dependent methyltransferase
MIQKCPVCNSSKNKFLNLYRGNHKAFINKHKKSCLDCGLVFASPMPTKRDLDLYNSAYFNKAHGGLTSNHYENSFFMGIAKLRANYIKSYLAANNLHIKKILEIGPGQGFFAKNWINLNPKVIYSAIETDLSCIRNLKKIGVNTMRTLNFVKYKKNDLIVMSHVLEHVANPKIFVKNISKHLSNSGVIFIEVPCLDHLHKSIDEPHLLFFDKQSLHKLLINSGYDNIQITYHGKSLANLISSSNFSRKLLSIRHRLITLGLLFPFNFFLKGLESLTPLEIALLKPFKAHEQNKEPSWWIRAIAMKVNK